MSDWQPTATLETLHHRARSLATIRNFFAERAVLEVETPLLARCSVTDPFIDSFGVDLSDTRAYLQTSPEYHMKRLLAAGSGDIYQLGRSFRAEEKGLWHRPEFTILEWYRCGFGMADLVEEVCELIRVLLGIDQPMVMRYQEAFLQHCQLDPLNDDTEALRRYVQGLGTISKPETLTRDDCLNLIMTEVLEPHFSRQCPLLVLTHYPSSQAALARISPDNPKTAERFEVFVHGIECGNGFHELADADVQRRRFERNQVHRREMGRPEMVIDEQLLSALEAGLPDCSGVAMGVDRLVAIGAKLDGIADCQSFADEI